MQNIQRGRLRGLCSICKGFKQNRMQGCSACSTDEPAKVYGPHILKTSNRTSISIRWHFAFAFAVYKLTYVYVAMATKPVHRLQIRPVHN